MQGILSEDNIHGEQRSYPGDHDHFPHAAKTRGFSRKKLAEGNHNTGEIIKLSTYIWFDIPRVIVNVRIVSLRDSSQGGDKAVYGNTGGICGLLLENGDNGDNTYHPTY